MYLIINLQVCVKTLAPMISHSSSYITSRSTLAPMIYFKINISSCDITSRSTLIHMISFQDQHLLLWYHFKINSSSCDITSRSTLAPMIHFKINTCSYDITSRSTQAHVISLLDQLWLMWYYRTCSCYD